MAFEHPSGGEELISVYLELAIYGVLRINPFVQKLREAEIDQMQIAFDHRMLILDLLRFDQMMSLPPNVVEFFKMGAYKAFSYFILGKLLR